VPVIRWTDKEKPSLRINLNYQVCLVSHQHAVFFFAKKCSEIVVEPFDDGWPGYEEIVIDVQA
jgi:hypothetical protein